MMNKLRNFMYGRYGTDELNICLWIAAIVLVIISYVFSWLAVSALVSTILRAASIVLFVLTIFRSFSRNISARQKENYAFRKAWNAVKGFFSGLKGRSDKKTHRYFRCPNCSQKVRVPRGKGKIAIKCPTCGEKFIRKT